MTVSHWVGSVKPTSEGVRSPADLRVGHQMLWGRDHH